MTNAKRTTYADKLTAAIRDPKLIKPSVLLDESHCLRQKDCLDTKDYQRTHIDIIPENWLVLQLSLDVDHNRLQFSRFRSGCQPFSLSIPLQRQDPQEADDEAFGYEQGRRELKDILEKANSSAQKAKHASTKSSQKSWWIERSSLDARLKGLLTNIEKVWLGGFRAILSAQRHCAELLARLEQSIQRSLDKHLPSRQSVKETASHARTKFETPVVELFAGLGDPTSGIDIDESLTDLIYFIVDILQFHGERNAYDEIDMDAVSDDMTDYSSLANTRVAYHRIDGCTSSVS